MSALLVYRNDTAPVMEWWTDFEQRSSKAATGRWDWMAKLYDEHQVHDDKRGAFLQDHTRFSGLSWPDDQPLPKGWLRPKDSPQLIRPRLGVKIGKTIDAEMRQFDMPDLRAELRQFGMPEVVFIGLGMLRAGLRKEDDGIWVTWGDRAVADKIGDVESHGWVRVPLVEYIERFGEDAL